MEPTGQEQCQPTSRAKPTPNLRWSRLPTGRRRYYADPAGAVPRRLVAWPCRDQQEQAAPTGGAYAQRQGVKYTDQVVWYGAQ
jgi:hypothetical protein